MQDVAKGSVVLTPRFDNLCQTVERLLGDAFGKAEGAGSKGGEKAGAGFSKGLGTKIGAVAGIVSTVANKAFSAISSSLDSAISRVDTMNNFPRVMAGLGYSADDASASISKMSDHLTGLPTRLDSMTASVQKIVPTVKDVGKSTDIMLAFNDALLAGGASTQVQEAALEQFTQVLAKGKPEMEDWRSIVQAMPGQMDQVAQSLLGAGASSNDLYQAMKDGKVSVEDLENAFVSLDTTGYAGFASFAEQAKNGTAGIATSLANAQNSVVKFVAGVIDAIGTDTITAPIAAFTGAMKAATSAVTSGIGEAKGQINQFIGDIERMAQSSGPVSDLAANVDIVARALRGVAEEGLKAVSGVLPLGDIAGSLNAGGAAGIVWNLAGAINGLIEKAGGIQSVCSWIHQIGDSVTNGLAGAIGNLPALFEGGFSVISAVVSGVLEVVSAAVPLIPPLIDTVSAAIQTAQAVVTQVYAVAAPIISQVLALVQAAVAALVPAIDSVLQTVQAAMPLIQSVITIALGAIQAVWNAVWPVIANVAMTVITAVSSAIQVAMAVIQTVISVVMAAISGDWDGAWQIIRSAAETVWSAIESAVSSAINAVSSVISSVLSTISSVWNSTWSSVKSFFSNMWGEMQHAAQSGVNLVYGVVTGIKGKITGFFSGAGSWLVDSGKAILNGLKEGIEGAIGSVTSAVSGAVSKIRSFFPFSPAKRGPFSGHGYTTYSGRALMGDFGASIESAAGGTAAMAARALSRVQDVFAGEPVEFAAARPRGAAVPAAQAASTEVVQRGDNYYVTIDGSLVEIDERLASALRAVIQSARAASRRRG